MSKLSLSRTICFVCIFSAVEVVGSPAQTFKSLVTFNGTDGEFPTASLVQGSDGNFYGATAGGGSNNFGTVFKITPAGKLNTVHNFCAPTNCPDGGVPDQLILATDGNFYGTTHQGGTNTSGTVFKVTPKGNLVTLYSFCSRTNCADGALPIAGLVQARDGNFYGTTIDGGNLSVCNGNGCGTVFKITSKGKLTTLHNFSGTDGSFAYAGLIQARDGNFYGTTYNGGANGPGTVFKITPAGKLITLYSFCSQSNCTDGSGPMGRLVQATNGNFYGTTYFGGTNGFGTVFEITPEGNLTSIFSFDNTDGSSPIAGLVEATDGMFYGTTSSGGAGASGTAFKITPAGMLTTLHSFCSRTDCADGAYPYAGLVEATDGTFYGATDGQSVNDGTVFRLSVGLGPFVRTIPSSGKVGQAVMILGNNMKCTTRVTFNGTAARFTLVSGTEIKTFVPSGATTGFVRVTAPKKTLKSSVIFRMTK
jgi:uncharacterized repeat protein (TIGR03803 family)